MFNWIEELLAIRLAYLERKIELRNRELKIEYDSREAELELIEEQNMCESCEVLKLELAKAHDLNNELIRKLTDKSVTPEKQIDITELKPITPARHMSFQVRRQMMEAEDRRRAQSLREAQLENTRIVPDESKLPSTSASTEVDSSLTAELEAELDIASDEREAQSGQRMAGGE